MQQDEDLPQLGPLSSLTQELWPGPSWPLAKWSLETHKQAARARHSHHGAWGLQAFTREPTGPAGWTLTCPPLTPPQHPGFPGEKQSLLVGKLGQGSTPTSCSSQAGLYFEVIFVFVFFVLAMLMACGSSRARDGTLATTATQAALATMLDP